MNFLFRRPLGGHIFMTTQDPSYIYTVLCGKCDYPIEAEDEVCPRCQVRLEDCPVCRDIRHTKAPKVEPCKDTGRRTCPVCDTRRYPFGMQALSEIEGMFCTNLYGCPAGGLLLKTQEFAVLRPEATLCPICKHPDLKPLDIRTFIYLITQCVFCNAVFGTPTHWDDKWGTRLDVTTDLVMQTPKRDYSPCPLCGREDEYPPGAGNVQILVDEPGKPATAKMLSPGLYARVVELGKILILENDPVRASKSLFSSWFDPLHLGTGEAIRVEEANAYLLQGTRKSEIHKILRARTMALLESWKQQVPGQGLGYPLGSRGAGGGQRAGGGAI
jgi:hypothetical protein